MPVTQIQEACPLRPVAKLGNLYVGRAGRSRGGTTLAGALTCDSIDPFGGDTNRSQNQAMQPHRFTSYERDGLGADDAMFRRYNRWWGAFDQPDPYDGSYELTDPQSMNRYAYVQNDPVNFIDPSGLDAVGPRPFWPTPAPQPPTFLNPNLGMTFWVNSLPPEVGSLFGDGGDVRMVIEIPGMQFLSELAALGLGGPQNPAQATPNPNPQRSQQSEFNECAKKAWRSYRKTYLKTSGKAIGGGVGLGIGLSVMRGAPTAAGVGLRSVGFGFRGAMHSLGDKALTPVGRVLTAYVESKDSGFIGGMISIFGGGLVVNSVREAGQNENRLNAALDNCKKQFPNANHSLTFLNF